MMRRVKISLLAVDESHCISQVRLTWMAYVLQECSDLVLVGRKFPAGILEDCAFRGRTGCRARPLSYRDRDTVGREGYL